MSTTFAPEERVSGGTETETYEEDTLTPIWPADLFPITFEPQIL